MHLPSHRGQRRKLVTAMTVLAFLAIIAIALYALSLIAGAVILLLLSALLAYIIYPLVQLLQRRLRRSLAITVAYLLVAVALAGGMFIVTSSLIGQSTSIAQSIHFLLSPAGQRQLQPVIAFLGKLGITKEQVALFKNQLLAQVQSALSGLLPFLTGLVTNILNLIVVITLSVYFVVDGPRIIGWLRLKTPATQRGTINFLLNTLDQILSPRIFSQTVGVHPIVALFTLFAGAELFGLLGGFLSVLVAGALQHIIVALWHRWKEEHPEQFPPEEVPLQPSASL